VKLWFAVLLYLFPHFEQKLTGGVIVDWTAGSIAAPGVAAADLRAPNTEVARVGAERAATERARAALAKAIHGLPLAAGGSVGAGAKLDGVLAQARAQDVSYAADGGARVLLAVPLEAIRSALDPPAAPAFDAKAPTAIIVDARHLPLRPALGVRVAAGGTTVALPTVFQLTPEAAAADPRAGTTRVETRAAAYNKGTVTVPLEARALESAARAGALIVVLVSEGAKK
jgi:hypothetical protein